ncbi:MAG: ABC transporter permease [Phycisphaerae bacterium]|nr:ABC transporter permease [Phycisphaerae bacterium]
MRRTWAVARNMIAEAIRMKIALVLLIIMVAVIPLGPFIWEGDGTLKGRVQTFLTYSNILVLVMLSIMTVFVACQSLSSEVSGRQIYTIATKPLPRWQFILGKWVGLCLLNALLLGVCGLAIYLFTMYMYGLGLSTRGALPQTLDKQSLRYEVLTARQGIIPPVPDFTEVVNQRYDALKASGQLPRESLSPDEIQSIKLDYYREARQQWRSVPPGGSRSWTFENLRPGSDCEWIHLRYKMRASPLPPRMQVECVWLLGDPISESALAIPRSDSIDQWHYFPFKRDVIGKDGTLKVTFVNRHLSDLNKAVPSRPSRSTVVFEEPDGLEILYEVGSFEGNFLRSMLLIFIWLMPLAALGLLAGSFLSFSVGALLCSAVLIASALSDFVWESLYWVREAPKLQQDPLDYFSWIFKPFIHLIINVVPSLGRYSPVDLLADGRVIEWLSVAQAFGMMVLVQAAIFLVLAIIIFTKRELAQVTV